jgi:hypothetical protein
MNRNIIDELSHGVITDEEPCDWGIPDQWSLEPLNLVLDTATNRKFVCSSTPWNKDSVFYKIFHHESYRDFAKHHVGWRQALEPNGPLKKGILNKLRRQFAEDPWRWKPNGPKTRTRGCLNR